MVIPAELKPKLFKLSSPTGNMRMALSGGGKFKAVTIERENEDVIGWACLSTYLGDDTFSVYVDPTKRGSGIAGKLTRALFKELPKESPAFYYSAHIAFWLEPIMQEHGFSGIRITDPDLLAQKLIPKNPKQWLTSYERDNLANFLVGNQIDINPS